MYASKPDDNSFAGSETMLSPILANRGWLGLMPSETKDVRRSLDQELILCVARMTQLGARNIRIRI